MIILRIQLFDEPQISPLTEELIGLGVIENADVSPVSTIVHIMHGESLLEDLEWKHKLDDSEIQRLQDWASKKYGEPCEVQIKDVTT